MSDLRDTIPFVKRAFRAVATRARFASSVEGLTIKAALFIGFGLTLSLWLFAGYQFTRRMADVEARSEAISARYMRAQELLSNVRAQVLLESVYVRDALMDPNPTSAADSRRRMEATYVAVEQGLQQYVPVTGSEVERDRVVRLRREINDFHGTMVEVLSTDSSRWRAEARDLLNRLVVPKREVVIRVSEEVQALNRNSFVQQQTDIAAVHRGSQRRILAQLGFALLASLGIALLATVYSSRLESRIRRQQLKDLENARDLQRLSAKLVTVQEEERRAIARELHDEVGQALSAIKVELSVAERTIGSTGPRHLLDDARAITEGALHTVRDLSHLLHPALLDDLGLPAAIDWYLRSFGKRYGLRVELLQDHMDERLTPEIEASAYRIVQEALTNVMKHARASACRVYVQRLPNTMLLTIEDNGAGFDAAETTRSGARQGLGLIGIRERASHLGGTVRIESTLAKGTRLTVELPARVRTRTDEADAAGVLVTVSLAPSDPQRSQT